MMDDINTGNTPTPAGASVTNESVHAERQGESPSASVASREASEAAIAGTAYRAVKKKKFSLFSGFGEAMKRFALPYAILVIIGLLLMVMYSAAIKGSIGVSVDRCAKLLSPMLLAFSMTFMTECLALGGKAKPWLVWTLRVISIAVSVAFFFWAKVVPAPRSYTVLALVAFSMMALAFSFPKKGEECSRYAVRFALRSWLASVACSVFMGGCAILFVSVSLLLKGDMDNVAYPLIAIVTMGFPLLASPALIPKAHEEKHNRALSGFMTFGVLPLFGAFTLVFYIYLAKILLIGEWPVGEVAPLALFGSAVEALALFFFSGDKDSKAWKISSVAIPIAWLPPLLMMFASCRIRIDAYGLTPTRLLMLIAGIWTLVISIVTLAARKKISSRFYTISLAVCMVVFAIAPGVNVFSLSKMSQTARLNAALARADMGSVQNIIPNPNASKDDRSDVLSIANWLYANDMNAVPDFDGTNAKEIFGFNNSYEYDYDDDQDYAAPESDDEYTPDTPTYADNYDVAHLDTTGSRAIFMNLYENEYHAEESGVTLDISKTGGDLVATISVDGKTAVFNVDQWVTDSFESMLDGDEEWYSSEYESDGIRVKVLFEYISDWNGERAEYFGYSLLVME